MREILGIIMIGFIVAGGPIVFLVLTHTMPWYLIVMYCIWVAGCLATIDEEIAQKFEQISKLWRNTRTKVKVNRFIELLVTCGEDVLHFMNNNEINNTKNTELAIKN